jgi:Radical SAM superfamily
MESEQVAKIHDLKISAMAHGVRIAPNAMTRLTDGGKSKITIHEYATTGGITVELEGGVFVNAPFDESFCRDAEPLVQWTPESDAFSVGFRGDDFAVRILPLPGYLDRRDDRDRLVTDSIMSHADRARLSPVGGCVYSCRFCDLPGRKYLTRPSEQLLRALAIAMEDEALPVKHLLISGGTPAPADAPHLEGACRAILTEAKVPVDIMMSPPQDTDLIDRLSEWGIHGFSINLEVFDRETAKVITPQKWRLGRETFTRTITRAVERTGGRGRVRSLLVVGLESVDSTLEAIEYLARLGCDPVLSPFRPVNGIRLHDHAPPSLEFLAEVHQRSNEVARSYGVRIGPRCIPCQNNTLAFPDGTADYYYS